MFIDVDNYKKLRNSMYKHTNDNFLPLYYIIEPTNCCNYSCIMCPNKLYSESEKNCMNYDLFLKIIDQISNHAIYIQLYWVGEPLMCNRLCDMISYIKYNTKAKVIISTNGSKLEQKMAEKIIKSGLDILIISLDSVSSEEIYQSIRCDGKLDIIIKNTEDLLLLAQNSPIEVIIQMISFKSNTEEWSKLQAYFKKYKCKVQLAWLDTWANQFSELSNLSEYLSPNRNLVRKPCSDLWYKASIHWDGRVSVCCHDWAWKVVIGDLKYEKMFDIWNSELINKYRKWHSTGKYKNIELCNNCTEWANEEEYYIFLTNKEISEMKSLI